MNETSELCPSTSQPWDGNWTSGPIDAQYLPCYNENAPTNRSRQIFSLSIICICNALICVIVVFRIRIRIRKLKRLRADDWWILIALAMDICLYCPAQIVANRYGSGLQFKNISVHDRVLYWRASWGYSTYYLIVSMIKISICSSQLNILPRDTFTKFRTAIRVLCVCIGSLGLSIFFTWSFVCAPARSNYDYYTPSESCLDLDYVRSSWIGISVLFDLIILYIPFQILKMTNLRHKHKVTVMTIFCANLAGTTACLIGIYGIYKNKYSSFIEYGLYNEVVYLALNNLEILTYTIGACFPVFSPAIIAWFAKQDIDLTCSYYATKTWISSLKRGRSRSSQVEENGITEITDVEMVSVKKEDAVTLQSLAGYQARQIASFTASVNNKVVGTLSSSDPG